VDVLGPVTAPLAKIGQRYRWQIILKAEQLKVLHLFVGQLEEMHPTFFRSRQIKVDIDVDPYLMM
jgi:primosomal protein N' (replication factor Y)